MKKEDNKTSIDKFYSIMMFSTIVLVIGLILIGLWFRNNFKCEGDMFSYSGAVIGGGMTLLGVIFTINHTNAIREKDRKERDLERKEELAIRYKPILTITSNFELLDRNGKSIKKLGIDEYKHGRIYVKLKNNGRGEANNIHILPKDSEKIINTLINSQDIFECDILTPFDDGILLKIEFDVTDRVYRGEKIILEIIYNSSFDEKPKCQSCEIILQHNITNVLDTKNIYF